MKHYKWSIVPIFLAFFGGMVMSQKLLLIMNPVAGTKKSNKHLTEIISLFCENGFECHVQTTSTSVGADKIAKEFSNDKDIVVCIGGDGTFNEMVSGLVEAGYKQKIGYIPSGSTNDFASGLKLSHVPLKAAQDIISGQVKTLDVGKFNNRIFTYTASFGVFTKSSYNTPRDLKNALGYLAYVLEGAKELTDVPSIHMKAKYGKKEVEGNYIFGAVCNSKRLGGGFVKFNDDTVDMNDGLLEVLLIKYPKNPAEATQTLIDLKNGKFSSQYFDFFSASQITFTTDDEVDWTIDGEYQKGSDIITVKNIKSAISLILK